MLEAFPPAADWRTTLARRAPHPSCAITPALRQAAPIDGARVGDYRRTGIGTGIRLWIRAWALHAQPRARGRCTAIRAVSPVRTPAVRVREQAVALVSAVPRPGDFRRSRPPPPPSRPDSERREGLAVGPPVVPPQIAFKSPWCRRILVSSAVIQSAGARSHPLVPVTRGYTFPDGRFSSTYSISVRCSARRLKRRTSRSSQ